MGYYVGVAVIGGVMSAVGVGLAFFQILVVILSVGLSLAPPSVAGQLPDATQLEPNVGMILIGGLILVVGVLLVLAGLFGSLYKLIADAVAEGRRMSELDEEESVAGDTETEDDEATDDDTDGESDADATDPESTGDGGGGDDTDGDTDAADGDVEDSDTADEDAADAGNKP
jgi:hypothetical protein